MSVLEPPAKKMSVSTTSKTEYFPSPIREAEARF